MEPAKNIENFLALVRRKRAGAYAVNGAYLAFALLTGCYLAVNLLSYFSIFSIQAGNYLPAFFLPCLAFLLYILWRYFVRGALSPFPRDRAALLVEARFPDLNNALINACQLRRHLASPENDRRMSLAFIHELIRETGVRIQGISADSVIDREEAVKNRNLFLAILGLFAVFTLALPDFLNRGYSNFFAPAKSAVLPGHPKVEGKTQAPPPAPPPVYAVKDMTLTFNYPAYTRLKSSIVPHSDGKIHVLPGTETRVQAKIDKPAGGANLVLNGKDSFAMSLDGETEIAGQLLIKEEGHYQIQIKSPDGRKVVLPAKYPVSLARDNPPRIIVFASNPKPVYYATDKVQLLYEGADDYGIQKIELVADIDGKTARIPIKSFRDGTREAKDSYAWNLTEMGFGSGEKVKYYLEIQDNDNVLGPNIAQSEAYSFTIFDLRGEQENLIQMQEELIEKMVGLLAYSLVGGETYIKGNATNEIKLKKFMSVTADYVIMIVNLAQRIHDQAKSIPLFPESYLTLLKNVISGLTQIRAEQIESINKINAAIAQAAPIGYNFPPFDAVNEKLIVHLEKDILFLVKIANRQKMGRVMDLKQDLKDLTESLKREFEKVRDKKAPLSVSDFKTHIEKIKQTLQQIMEQLTRQTQPSPDEFLNPNSFKTMDFEKINASLEKIMDLVNQKNMNQALKEIEKLTDELKSLSQQLDRENENMDKLVDLEIMKKIDDSLRDVMKLEKEQTELLEQTGKINQSLRTSQSRNYEERLKKLFEALKRDVNDIQAILRENSEFLEQHPAMKRFGELLAQEAREGQEIKNLNQRTLDSKQASELDSNFKKLGKAREKHSETMAEMEALRLGVIQRFKNFLPQYAEKYGSLEELTELLDLPEFNAQFKNLYPEALRWQSNLHATPNVRADLVERLDGDLAKINSLNAQISKKLGTMMRDLEKNYDSLVTPQNKDEMTKMAKKQSQMGDETADLVQRFAQMTQQNPLINPELSAKMANAGQDMRRAENNLKKHDVIKSIDAENGALKELAETRDLLNELKNANTAENKGEQRETTLKLGTGRARDQSMGGELRTQKEKVTLPSEDQFHAPKEFREEILKAMKNRYPQQYERFVTEYYKELVK